MARQIEDISKQSLNSHHDPNLDIENLSNFDTGYTCDPDICVEINSAMPPVSISFAGIKSYPNTPEVHMTVEDTEDFDDTCAVCAVMNKCISSDGKCLAHVSYGTCGKMCTLLHGLIIIGLG